MIVQRENLLSPDECALVRAVYDEHAPNTSEKDYSGWPVVRHSAFINTPAYAVIQKAVAGALAELAAAGVSGQYLETVLVTALGTGGHHMLHADNSKLESGAWVPNHTPHRSYTCMQYLNGNFDGGEICLPNQGTVIKPTEGMLIAFPADHEHVHEVRPVLGGKRYALAIWLTEQPDRQLHF